MRRGRCCGGGGWVGLDVGDAFPDARASTLRWMPGAGSWGAIVFNKAGMRKKNMVLKDGLR